MKNISSNVRFAVCFFIIHLVLSIMTMSLSIVFAEDTAESKKELLPIQVNADNVEYIKEKEIVRGTGDVVINFKGVTLRAEQITVNLVTKDAYADGNVRFYQGDTLYTADHAYYNFDSEVGRFEYTNGRFKPFYLFGSIVKKKDFTKEETKYTEYHVEDGYITTSDYILPDYKLTASSARIIPNDKVLLKNIVLRLGKVPVFWFPFWYFPLNTAEAPFTSVPGKSGRWGYYLLNSAQIYRSEKLKVRALLDWRSDRGAGGGAEGEYKFDPKAFGEFKTYFIKDRNFEEYDVKADGTARLRKDLKKDRFRVSWEHEHRVSPEIRMLSELNVQSDKQIIDDFFKEEYGRQSQRPNFFDITKANEAYQFEFFAMPRFNSFFDVLERLPEASFTKKRNEVYDTGIFYESDVRAGNYRFKFDADENDFDALRFSTLHKASMPFFLWDFMNFTPYLEGRTISYSEMRAGSEKTRGVFAMGFDSSFRVSKIYNAESEAWNIHGLRHIFEPAMDFRLVRTNYGPERVYQFDQIDAPIHDTFVSFRFRNVLQTKRQKERYYYVKKNEKSAEMVKHRGFDEVSVDLIDFSISFDVFPSKARRDTFSIGHISSDFENISAMDFFFRRNIALGSPFVRSTKDEYLSELLVEMKFAPFEWFETRVQYRYDPHDRQLEELKWVFSFFNTDKISWDIATTFNLGGSTQLGHTFNYRFNADWRVSISHVLDFNRENSAGGARKLQRYVLVKDLHEWEMALTYMDRGYERGREVVDRSFFVIFYLKDYPTVRFKVGN
ncbi:LPS-assembly protein LptD [bacterium]|nr:LPS-assembly protein LptD [bacterium]MCP5463146.1 LPS-assembly protein LptD [bacterium]